MLRNSQPYLEARQNKAKDQRYSKKEHLKQLARQLEEIKEDKVGGLHD